MDFIVCAGSLSAELVAGNIQDLQPLIVVILIQLLNGSILRRKTAAVAVLTTRITLPLYSESFSSSPLPVVSV